MEQGRQTPREARTTAIADLFAKELKKLSDRIEKVRDRPNGVYTNGTINRRGQEILHLKQRQTELANDRDEVLQKLSERPTQTYRIGIFFERKLDKIDLEIEATRSHPHGVILNGGTVKGKKQELGHLTAVRTDMLRVGNNVLDVLGLQHLVDETEVPRSTAHFYRQKF